MEALERMAESLSIEVIDCWGWPACGGTYITDGSYSLIHIDVTKPVRQQRWILAHELGHHWYQQSVWNQEDRMEALANRYAVELLLKHYHPEDIEWPPESWPYLAERGYYGEEWAA